MATTPPDGFDEVRADNYQPRSDFVKTAVLVEVADDDAVTEIVAPFGAQRLRGPFYAVVEGDATYGAAKREFEAAHVAVGANRWAKSEPVDAYRSATSCTIRTVIDGHRESTVDAVAGDWIVRQATGEIMVLGEDAFAERFVAHGST